MKRLVDLILTLVAALLLLLPALMVSVLVKLTSKGPVLYWSDRVGKSNGIFKMPKFRRMKVDTPVVATHLLADPVDCGTSDVGDLNALYETHTRDEQGNVCQGDTLVNQSSHCFVKSTSRLIAVQGVEGLAIVETKDAVLVAPLAQAQDIKQLVTQLKLQKRDELVHQREVYRPWGSHDSVDSGPNYQVKRITVNLGARLSVQKHKYRAEHWVVVSGLATVHLDGNEHTLKSNDSIYIQVGAVHSLANNTSAPLHLIEVQSGSYLGEDDIERLEDLYGRC